MKNQEITPVEKTESTEINTTLVKNIQMEPNLHNISSSINFQENLEDFLKHKIENEKQIEIEKKNIIQDSIVNPTEEKDSIKLNGRNSENYPLFELLKENYQNLNHNINNFKNNVNFNIIDQNDISKNNQNLSNINKMDELSFPSENNKNNIKNLEISMDKNESTNINHKQENSLEMISFLSNITNINLENLDVNTINQINLLLNNFKNIKKNDINQNLIESLINQIDLPKYIEVKKEEENNSISEPIDILNSLNENKNNTNTKNVKKEELEENDANINNNIISLKNEEVDNNHLQYFEKIFVNNNEIIDSTKNNLIETNNFSNVPIIPNQNLLNNLVYGIQTNNIDFSNLNINLANSEELSNNLHYISSLLGSGNLQNLETQKNQFQNLIGNLNIPKNYLNNFSQNLSNNNLPLNPNLNNLSNFSENAVKLESVKNSQKGLINFNLNLHFNLNIFTDKNNNKLYLQNEISDPSKNFNDTKTIPLITEEEQNKNFNAENNKEIKEENQVNQIDSNGNLENTNPYLNNLAELEEYCTKYNHKMLDCSNQTNLEFSANIANYNNLLNKSHLVNLNSKFGDYLNYVNMFKNPEMNNQILNFIKSNFDLNKIGDDFKNLILSETGINTSNFSNESKFNNQNLGNNTNNLSLLLNNLFTNLNQPNYSTDSNNLQNNQNNLNFPNLLNENKNDSQQSNFLNNLYNLANLGNLSNYGNDKYPRMNISNNENLNDLRNPFYQLNNTDKDIINELNNFNNVNSLNNIKNSSNNNKSSIFLSNKINRRNSNPSFSGDKKNLKSSKIDGKLNDSQINCSSITHKDHYSNEFCDEENYYKNRGAYNQSNETKINNEYPIYSREKDDVYDFLKSKKFHIKKYLKNDQVQQLNEAAINNPVNVTKEGIESNTHLNNSQTIITENKVNRENRKFKADSIHKKIKVNILKYLKGIITEFIPNKRINNLSQEIITNVNISFNKELLEKQVYKIYEDDYIETDAMDCLDNIKKGLIENREFFEIMNLTLKDFIIYKYWKSDFHKKKLTKIFQQESYEYYVNYEFLDKEFINYFLNNKGNKRKIKRNKKFDVQDGKSEYSLLESNQA